MWGSSSWIRAIKESIIFTQKPRDNKSAYWFFFLWFSPFADPLPFISVICWKFMVRTREWLSKLVPGRASVWTLWHVSRWISPTLSQPKFTWTRCAQVGHQDWARVHEDFRTFFLRKERSHLSNSKGRKVGRAWETAIKNFTESLNVCNCTVTSSLQVLLSSDPQNGVEPTEEDYSETPLGHGEKGSEQTSGAAGDRFTGAHKRCNQRSLR